MLLALPDSGEFGCLRMNGGFLSPTAPEKRGIELQTKLAEPQSYVKKRSVIVGAGFSGRTLAREIIQSRNGYEAVGFVDDDPGKADQCFEGLRILGRSSQLADVIKRYQADTVILAINGQARTSDLTRVLSSCESLGVRVVDMPSVFEKLTGKVPVEHVERSWFPVGVEEINVPRGEAFWRRVGETLLSAVALTGFALTLPAAALAIRLDSRGPVFFSQERVGHRGRVFRVHKLRTMIADAETNGEAVWAETDDTRVTRVGRHLRKLRFDEFPQFWNVLRGQMAVVGPRPERPFFVERLRKELPHYDLRHLIKPGITGWAQICQGYASSSQESFEKLQFDLYYLRHRSIVWDLSIILKTARVVLLGTGAK